MAKYFQVGSTPLTISIISEILELNKSLKISTESKKKIKECRDYLDRRINDSEEPIYGVNTGFGALCDCKVSKEELQKLQKNLILSHACGTGDAIPQEVVKIMLLLKIQSLSYGHSGIQLNTIQRLIDMYNANILPVVYEQGSLGASGDLVPLAHLSLPLLGLGEVDVPGTRENGYYKRRKAAKILKRERWRPI